MQSREEIKLKAAKELTRVPAYNASRELQIIQIELLLDIREILKNKYDREFPWEV